jgi:hypothetical protein
VSDSSSLSGNDEENGNDGDVENNQVKNMEIIYKGDVIKIKLISTLNRVKKSYTKEMLLK